MQTVTKTFRQQLQLDFVSSVLYANEKSRRNTSANNKFDLIGASDRAKKGDEGGRVLV